LLAQRAMRRLPRHYATCLSARALEEITTAAATGQWETAIDQLITTLHARAETITDSEREELRAVMEVLSHHRSQGAKPNPKPGRGHFASLSISRSSACLEVGGYRGLGVAVQLDGVFDDAATGQRQPQAPG
jgi:hypothetical protein